MSIQLPSQDAVWSVMQLTERTPEAAEYLYHQFKKILNGQLPEVLMAVKAFWESVVKQFSLDTNPMAGEMVFSPEEKREHLVAAPLPEPTPSAAQQINLDIQIGDNSRMERRYRVGDKLVDSSSRTYLDGLMKSWIAKSKMVRELHIMYPSKPTQDEFGKKIPISPEKLQEKIEDPSEGITPYINQQSAGKYQVQVLNVEQIQMPPSPKDEGQPATKMGG